MKLEFIRGISTIIQERQEHEAQLTLCDQRTDLELSDVAQHLQIEPEDCFRWLREHSSQYATEFGKLTVRDVCKQT